MNLGFDLSRKQVNRVKARPFDSVVFRSMEDKKSRRLRGFESRWDRKRSGNRVLCLPFIGKVNRNWYRSTLEMWLRSTRIVCEFKSRLFRLSLFSSLMVINIIKSRTGNEF